MIPSRRRILRKMTVPLSLTIGSKTLQFRADSIYTEKTNPKRRKKHNSHVKNVIG